MTREIERYNLNAMYAKYRALLDAAPRAVDADFEQAANELKKLSRPRKSKPRKP